MWDYWHELFLNDAKYFAEKMNDVSIPNIIGVKNICPEDGSLDYRRNAAASILFSFTALEAILNEFAQEYVGKNKTSTIDREEFLSGMRIKGKKEKEYPISLTEKLNKWIPKICKNQQIGNKLMDDFYKAKEIRDALVHLKIYDDTMAWPRPERVYSVLDTVKKIILEIYKLYGKEPSSWIKNESGLKN